MLPWARRAQPILLVCDASALAATAWAVLARERISQQRATGVRDQRHGDADVCYSARRSSTGLMYKARTTAGAAATMAATRMMRQGLTNWIGSEPFTW